MAVPKKGIKTSEFWITTINSLIGIAIASGYLGEGPMLQAAGALQTLIGTVAYTMARATTKKAAGGGGA